MRTSVLLCEVARLARRLGLALTVVFAFIAMQTGSACAFEAAESACADNCVDECGDEHAPASSEAHDEPCTPACSDCPGCSGPSSAVLLSRIEHVSYVSITPKSDDAPEGLYWLPGDMGYSYVRMRMPTEPGSMYALDCRVRKRTRVPGGNPTWGEPTILVGVDDDYSWIGSVDGHVMRAFIAADSEATIHFTYWDSDETKEGMWYGCDAGKIG